MLVLALVGLLMAAIAYRLRHGDIEGRIQIARMQIRDLEAMVFRHRLGNNSECPSIQQWLEDKTLKSEPKDPWGHLLTVVCPGEHVEGGADIVSPGPDGRPGTKDDIESWRLQ
jgi:type II secretory pathway pseudopilin PulG